jgi:hypothetical protein
MEVLDTEPAASVSSKSVFTLSGTTCCEVPPCSTSCLQRMNSAGSSEITTRLHIKKIFFTVIAWVLHFSLIFGATRFSSVVHVYYRLWRQIGTMWACTILSQGNTYRWQMSVKKLHIRSAVSVFEWSWDSPTPGLEISLSRQLSYRCETKHVVVTSVSLQSPSWLNPRSPRHRKVNSRYLVTRILQVFVQGRFFSAPVNLAERKLLSSVVVT